MKIGILTFYNGFNFGANLQGLSTYLYLKKHGHEPIFINYKSKENYNRWLNLHSNPQFKTQLEFVNGIATNQTSFCFSPEDIYREVQNHQIEGIIIGSDAVLQHHSFLSRLKFSSTRLVRFVDFVPELLFPSAFWGLGTADKLPVCMMSVSSQNSPYSLFSRRTKRRMKECLSNIRYISVRDTWTQAMVNNIANKVVSVTPDPVFAFNQNAPELILTAEEIKEKYSLPDKYVLVCLSGQVLSIESLSELKEKYKSIGCYVVALRLPDGVKFNHNFDFELSCEMPSNDWFSIIKHSCGYIGVNMHPIVVSLHNAVPCFSIDNWGRTDFFNKKINDGSSKVLDIMKIFGVESNHRMVSDGTCIVTADEIFQSMMSYPVEKIRDKADQIFSLYSRMMTDILSSLK